MYKVEVTDDMRTHTTRTHTRRRDSRWLRSPRMGLSYAAASWPPSPSRGRHKLRQTDYISQISSLHCVLIVPVQ